MKRIFPGNGKRAGMLILIVGLAVTAVMAARFIKHRMDYAVTDAVFIRTDDLVTLGFDEVGGRVVSMAKAEGEAVEKGEPIASIDPTDYQLAVRRLAGEVNATQGTLEAKTLFLARLEKEVGLDEDIARHHEGNLKKQLAALEAKASGLDPVIAQLERDSARFQNLYEAKAVSKRRAEEFRTDLLARRDEKLAAVEEADATREALKAAAKEVQLAKARRSRVDETRKEVEALTARVASLRAARAKAHRDLARCVLHSPIQGRIAKKFASAGDVVSARNPIYALVNPTDVYALVLLEENKLEGVRVGCQAKFTVDAYPDRPFEGVVSQVLPASAATFALVPRDISAGEFTKVVQRIPVKIRITHGDLSLLKVGMGGEVEIRRGGDSA